MNHLAAEGNNAVERYLLGEFDETQRAEFEDHFFECPICADQVRTGVVFIDTVKSVFRDEERRSFTREADVRSKKRPEAKWKRWFQLPSLIPSFAAAGFAAIVAYQATVSIPSLERPLVLTANAIAPAAREASPEIVVDPRRAFFNVNFDVDTPPGNSHYRCEFQKSDAAPVLAMDCQEHASQSFTLPLLLPSKQFSPGSYVMVLRGDAKPQAEIQRYPFVIKDLQP